MSITPITNLEKTIMENANEVQPEVVEADTEGADIYKGVYTELGALPPATLISEEGLARLLGKGIDSVKRAIIAKELPPPIKLRGKNVWTVGFLIRSFETRLQELSRLHGNFKP